jgi:hypothetical protein
MFSVRQYLGAGLSVRPAGALQSSVRRFEFWSRQKGKPTRNCAEASCYVMQLDVPSLHTKNICKREIRLCCYASLVTTATNYQKLKKWMDMSSVVGHEQARKCCSLISCLLESKGHWRLCITLRITLFTGLCPSSGILQNIAFRKLDLFPFSSEGRERPTILGPLERASIPDKVTFLNLPNSSGRTWPWGLLSL